MSKGVFKYCFAVIFNVAFFITCPAQNNTFFKLGAGGGTSFSRINYLKSEIESLESKVPRIGAIAQYHIGLEITSGKWTSSIGTYNRIVNNGAITGRRLYNLVVSGGYSIHKSKISNSYVIAGAGYFYYLNTNNPVPVFYAQSIHPNGLIINTSFTRSVKDISKSSPFNLNFGIKHIRIFNKNAIIITLLYTKSFFYYSFFTYNAKIVQGEGTGKESSIIGKYNGDGLTLTLSYGFNTNQLHNIFKKHNKKRHDQFR